MFSKFEQGHIYTKNIKHLKENLMYFHYFIFVYLIKIRIFHTQMSFMINECCDTMLNNIDMAVKEGSNINCKEWVMAIINNKLGLFCFNKSKQLIRDLSSEMCWWNFGVRTWRSRKVSRHWTLLSKTSLYSWCISTCITLTNLCKFAR